VSQLSAFVAANTGFMIYVISAGLFSFMLCLFAPQIGKSLGLVDDPRAKSHSLHDKTTPLVGGLAIMVPWILLAKLDPILAEFFVAPDGGGYSAFWLSFFVLIFMLIGLIDDRFHLSALGRLIAMGPLFALFVLSYPSFAIDALTAPAFGITVPLGLLTAPFTALCLLALTNAINMADGRNGLVIGLSILWCLTLSLHVPPQFQLLLYAAITSLIVTGMFNLRGRLFLGDGGTYALSAMIGLISLYAHGMPFGEGGISSPQLAALFAIPGLDMFRLMLARKARGVSPMSGDHDHLHHRLERYMGWRLGLPAYLALVCGPILIAFSDPKMGALGLIAAVCLYGATWLVTRKSQQRHFTAGGSGAAIPAE
jgi:UDP-GlcNAc:undecaprenyl-phosphate GlcNAc-1-phosphate transferase